MAFDSAVSTSATPHILIFPVRIPYGFFSDSFPILTGNTITTTVLYDHEGHEVSFPKELISAVDVRYNNKLIFSRVQEEIIMTDTTASSRRDHRSAEPEPFSGIAAPSLFQVLNPKESSYPLPIKSRDNNTIQRELEEKLELSWIIIYPAINRAVNISSVRPVSVQRQWITGEVEVKYSTIVNNGSSSGSVSLEVGITCNDGEGAGQLHVGEVWMHVEDAQGNRLNVRKSLGVLASLGEFGERKKRGEEEDYLWRYRKYMERKREWREREQMIRRKKKKTMCMAGCFGGVVTLFLSVCMLALAL